MGKSDEQLKQDIETELRLDPKVDAAQIGLSVDKCAVTLQGRAAWNSRCEASERVIGGLAVAVLVHDHLALAPKPTASRVKEKIDAALLRQAVADGHSIHVVLVGSQVTLRGHTSSWNAAEEAQNAAWDVPGVTHVVDELKIVSS